MIGPLFERSGPDDWEGAGRSAFWDLTPDQRKAALPRVTLDSAAGVLQADVKAFARGWLAELARVREAGLGDWGPPW